MSTVEGREQVKDQGLREHPWSGLRLRVCEGGYRRTPLPLYREGGVRWGIVVGPEQPEGIAAKAIDGLDVERWLVREGEVQLKEDGAACVEWRKDGAVAGLVAGGVELVHAIDCHEGGGSIPTEVGVVIARFVERLRQGGCSPIAVAVGPEVYMEVAKLRAIRMLAERVALFLGRALRVRIWARTSLVSYSRIEPETNALRATLSALASIFGGADFVGVAPYDVLAPGGPEVRSRALRLSATTGLIADLEAHLALVDDPLFGAYAIEEWTEALARKAWELVREIERMGGASQAVEWVRKRVGSESVRFDELALRGRPLRIGATAFARSDAPMLGPLLPIWSAVRRETAWIEALREGQWVRPTGILRWGDPGLLHARLAFIEERLRVLGIEPLIFEWDPARPLPEGADAFVICTEDKRFAELASLRPFSVPVALAGKAGALEGALRAVGIRAFLFQGCDLLAFARALYREGHS
ncbi:MAG: methylmalonyl-CoA mutase family protein [Sandaracinaceae bacterium]|nr:methylmalonyl-CoA mutase family protein [Sandaracinaceae bacterium]